MIKKKAHAKQADRMVEGIDRTMKRLQKLAIVFIFALISAFLVGNTGEPMLAQSVSWDIIDGSFDPVGYLRNMAGPVGNVLIEKRPIAWTATVAGMKMDGYGALYIMPYPPDMEDLAQRIPLLAGFNPFQDQAEKKERTDIFIIELLHPFLRGSNQFHGAFAGKAGRRTITIPNWLPYQDGDAREYPDRAQLRLNFSASSPLAVKADPDESYTVYGDRGALVVYEVDRGFYGTARVLLKPSAPVMGDAPFEEDVIEFRICEVAPEHEGRSFGQVPCLVGDVFQVLQHWPEAHRENVDYKDPAIRVAFSDSLSSASLEGNVEVFTMSSSGEKLNVPGTARVSGGNELIFVPNEPLLDGVIYEVRVTGGEGGVQSVNQDTLPGDFAWRFATVIDVAQRFDQLDFRSLMDDSYPVSTPVQSFVYQSVRDAPLIAGKPTLTRIYVHWKAYDHIAKDWQPTSFKAEVTVEDSQDGEIYTHVDRSFRIYRPDQYSALDLRFARNTVNLFNWRPMQTSASTTLTVKVEPEDVYPRRNEDYVLTKDKHIGRWPHTPKRMVFDYFLLPIGDWADGVPAKDEQLALQMSRATEIQLVQLFPIISARGRHMGTLVSNAGDWRTVGELFEDGVFFVAEAVTKFSVSTSDQDRRENALKRMMQRIHNVHGPRTNADVLVGYFPVSFYGAGKALSSIDHDWSTYDEIPSSVDFFRRTAYIPVWPEGPSSMGLAHEIGHTYHLHHQPISRTKQEREAVAARWQTGHYSGITGFRMAPSGTFGWNKSSRDGNAEDPETLLSFMFPVSRKHTETFILDHQYDSLLTTLRDEAVRKRDTRHAPLSVQVAAANPFAAALADGHPMAVPLSPGYQPDQGLMMIAGYLHKEDAMITIDAVRRRIEYARDIEPGPYSAVLLDENGSTLAWQPFGEYVIPGFADDDDPWMYFQVYLPEHERAHRIELREGDSLLMAWERPDWRPQVHFATTSGSDQIGAAPLGAIDMVGTEPITVRWEGNSDHLIYSLLYSPDGGFPWTTLAADTMDTSIEIDPRRLTPGSNPTLRLIAGNGFDEAEAVVPVKLQRDLEPIWLHQIAEEPADGTHVTMIDSVESMLDVEVMLSTDLAVSTVEGRMRLTDAAGNKIPSVVVYDETAQVVRLTPEVSLMPGMYRVTLEPGIADRYGNVLQREASLTFVVAEGDRELENTFDAFDRFPSFFEMLPPVDTGLVVPGV